MIYLIKTFKKMVEKNDYIWLVIVMLIGIMFIILIGFNSQKQKITFNACYDLGGAYVDNSSLSYCVINKNKYYFYSDLYFYYK